jgi:signal transduction histidine kinase
VSGNEPKSKKNLQAQLSRLLFALVVLSAVNAGFLWKTLSQLFDSYRNVSQGQTRTFLAGELERDFFEESRLRSLDDSVAEKGALPEVRGHIRKLFKEIRSSINEKGDIADVKNIEKSWHAAHDPNSSIQLLILTRRFISNKQKILMPLESSADIATKGMAGFLLLYLAIMASTILILMRFMKRRLFAPLFDLSEKMKYFQAGKVELPPLTEAEDEIGDLEEKFYDMAGRVGHTVTELKELDKVKTDFISIASHELRTPMTSVKGSLSLILTGNLAELSPDVREILTIAEKETDRLIRLINDILDLTKMEAKKLPLDKKWCDLEEIIQASVKGLGGLFEVTKVNVRLQKSNEGIKALVDHDRIQQVITNLLSNAVKFSPAGSDVVVYCGAHESGAVIKVRDSGPGIKLEDQPIVFEKFRSTDPRKSKIIKGTGLGLPICKALVEQHGGQIGLESEPGHGSTFYFTVPEVKITARANEGEAA